MSYCKDSKKILKIKQANSKKDLLLPFKDIDVFVLNEVAKAFPDTFEFISYLSEMDANITRKITKQPTFVNSWNVLLGRELDMTNDEYMFRNEKTEIPLWEGSLTYNYLIENEPKKYVDSKLFSEVQTSDFEKYRIVIRDILSDGARKVQCSIVPKRYALGNSLNYIRPSSYNTLKEAMFLVGILNSYVIEYRVQQTRSGYHLNHFRIKQLPIPKLQEGDWPFDQIVYKVAKLICVNENFSALWCEVMNSKWKSDCCVVDEKDRMSVQAEIDALVALIYGMSREEICYILDPQEIYGSYFPEGTFQVLKNKEIRIYGEYYTKELVLEKYEEFKPMFH